MIFDHIVVDAVAFLATLWTRFYVNVGYSASPSFRERWQLPDVQYLCLAAYPNLQAAPSALLLSLIEIIQLK